MKKWKTIPGYERYNVSNDGEIMGLKGSVMKPFRGGNGYLQVGLWRDCKKKRFYVHRLVAEAFIENPCCYTEVNHKDGNKKNNSASNLEWCTKRDNLLHSCYVLHNLVKPVMCVETGIVYPSIKEAARQTGSRRNGIAMCCSGRQKKANKLHWRYAV